MRWLYTIPNVILLYARIYHYYPASILVGSDVDFYLDIYCSFSSQWRLSRDKIYSTCAVRWLLLESWNRCETRDSIGTKKFQLASLAYNAILSRFDRNDPEETKKKSLSVRVHRYNYCTTTGSTGSTSIYYVQPGLLFYIVFVITPLYSHRFIFDNNYNN
jgi:hypothetical protein